MTLKLEQLNDNLICKLCNGYLINCVTIVECLHTFCKSCLIKYLESNKKCPKCSMNLSSYSKEDDLLKFDFKIQKLVYKILPSIFLNEKERRTKFYLDHPEDEINNELNSFKDDNLIWNLNDLINIKLEYLPNKTDQLNDLNTSIAKLRYLQVECGMDILHLKKWIKNKYDLSFNHKVIILFKNEILTDSLKMIDLAYILTEKNCPLNLYFYYYEISSTNKKKNIKIKRKLSNKKLLKTKKLKVSNDLIDTNSKNINDNKILNGNINCKINNCNINDNTNVPTNGQTNNKIDAKNTNGKLNGSNVVKKINDIKLKNNNDKSTKIKNQINKKSKLLNPLKNQTKQIENNQTKLNTIKVNKLSKGSTKKRKLNC